MDSQTGDFVQAHMAAFQEQLTAMAHHQTKALALAYRERLQHDLAEPPISRRRPSLVATYRWLRQRFVTGREPDEASSKSEDQVMVIDANYTVVSPEAEQTAVPTSEEGGGWNR